MFLHRIHLDSRCKEARRDLSDPYQLHSTLCRAFTVPDRKCPEGEFLWRLEPHTDPTGYPYILVQSRKIANWTGIGIKGWLAKADPALDLKKRLGLDSLKFGQRFRFRLRANPCVTRKGKRLGLLRLEQQEAWSQEQMLRGKKRSGKMIRIFSVLYDGILTVSEPDKFRRSLNTGIGHGKVMGLGLLSVVPIK